jgi:cholesterol oxidase
MLGCRYGAKNTLDRNYLHLARKQGLDLRAEVRVTAVRALETGGYAVECRTPQGRRCFTARSVVLAAGVLGSVELLLRMRRDPRGLPKLSPLVGRRVRTNSESFIGVISRNRDLDLSRGIAIGSIYHCAPGESVEPVRYSDGSGFFRLLLAPHVEGQTMRARLLHLIGACLRSPLQVLRGYTVHNFARQCSILMYMRTCEGTLRLKLKPWGLGSEREAGPAPVASFPEASQIARESCAVLDGAPFALINETLFNVPTTAHILGGATMGTSAESGVIDTNHEVHGYPGLYVMDGSSLSSNPGVNPALTITALAERAIARIPQASARLTQ